MLLIFDPIANIDASIDVSYSEGMKKLLFENSVDGQREKSGDALEDVKAGSSEKLELGLKIRCLLLFLN